MITLISIICLSTLSSNPVKAAGPTFETQFPNAHTAQVVANYFGKSVTDEITPTEVNTTTLNISNQNLTDLTGIGIFSDLTRLFISDNQLTTLPQELVTLINLTDLDISNNQISQLPQPFSNLCNLINFYAQNNQLTSLGDDFCTISTLYRFYAQNNRIASLPENMGSLQEINEVDLSYNQITRLPDSVINLNDLRYLDLSYNQLTSIPVGMEIMPNLRFMILEQNLLPTNYSTELNNLNFISIYFNETTQNQLKTIASPPITVIKNQSDLDQINFTELLELDSGSVLSSSHSYELEGFVDSNGDPVNLASYLNNGQVIKEGTLFAQVRATGQGVFPDTSDRALTAQRIQLNFEFTYYNLTFDLNGGEGTVPASQSLVVGDTGIKVPDPTKEGYAFIGWNTDINGNGTHWIPGTTPMIPVDITLYAQWEKYEVISPDTPETPESSSPGSTNSNNSQITKTGDSTHLILFSLLLFGSLSGLGVMIRRKEEKKNIITKIRTDKS